MNVQNEKSSLADFGANNLEFSHDILDVQRTSTNEKGLRVALGVFSLGVLAASSYFAADAIKNGVPNVRIYSFFTGVMGISTGALYSAITPQEYLSMINRAISSLSYPFLFSDTQVYDNLDSFGLEKDKLKEMQKILHGMLFIYVAGFLAARDIYTRFVASRSEFPDQVLPPLDESKLIPMFPPNTRNPTLFKFWTVTYLTISIALPILFFTFKGKITGDLHALGFWEKCAAVPTGYFLGLIGTRHADDYKEKLEFEKKASGIKELTCGLRSLRYAKNIYLLAGFSLLCLGLQLSSSSIPDSKWYVNSPEAYMGDVAVGLILGSLGLIAKRLGEDPRTNFFKEREVVQVEPEEEGFCTSKKVYEFGKSFFFSLFVLTGLLGWTILLGVTTDEPRLKGAASIMFVSTLLSYVATILTVKFHKPRASEVPVPQDDFCEGVLAEIKAMPLSAMNEIHSFLTNPYQVAFPFGYMRTIFDIDDRSILRASLEVLPYQFGTCAAWGGAWGNSLALYAMGAQPDLLTPPIVIVELFKAIVAAFRR